ncbi:MAG: TadE/TadG family type IV pilus assembly protein [Terracidiphilus sp.]
MKKLSNLRGQATPLLHGYFLAKEACIANKKTRLIGGRLRAFICSDGEGQSLVEFAILVPMLLMVLTFMFSISMAMVNYEQLSAAVSNAALQDLTNALVVSGGDPCASIQTAVSNALPSFTASKLTYTVTVLNSSGTAVTYGPTAGSSFSCSAAVAVLQADEAANQQTTSGTLTVTYTYTWIPVYMQKMTGNLTASQAVLVVL